MKELRTSLPSLATLRADNGPCSVITAATQPPAIGRPTSGTIKCGSTEFLVGASLNQNGLIIVLTVTARSFEP